ncbi:class I SAM-dependent methyltransferase [Micromonospora ureilytica]|uniref:SAM-dependent methyltransferase n=1 Tax=Micromonospora ureilytica TaxID=709868 RepID=UPI002E158D41|nr:class I SAM-dependent methyltransferase [Micromonospora ureilytica]
MSTSPAHPYLTQETGALVQGTALDAGCGAGAEAIWLAAHGWQVTAVDIAPVAHARAAERTTESGVSERVRWVEADLTAGAPETRFDLVTTIVGHLHTSDATEQGHGHGHGHWHRPPDEASITLADITAGLDSATWEITTAEGHRRTVPGREVPLHDVVVRAVTRL